MDISDIHLQIQKILQNTNWEWAGVLTMGKEYIEPCKSRLDKGRRGRKRRVIRNRSARGGVRELKQGSDPHIRATVWDRGEAFEAIVEWSSLSVSIWMEWQSHRKSYLSLIPGLGRFPIHTPERDANPLESTAAGSWSIEIGEQSQGKVGSSLWWPEGTWRRRSQWDMLAKESQAKWRQEDTAESYTAGGPIPIALLSQNVSTDTWKTPERVAL